MANPEVTTVGELIERFGGLSKAAEAFGEKPNTVSNWKERGIPGRKHMLIHQKAKERGIRVAPHLVGLPGTAHP